MECPKCHSEIGKSAQCGCGWRRTATAAQNVETVLCSRCAVSAMIKLKIGDEWVNFCLRHADEYRAGQAREYCAAKGLTTVRSIKAWLRDQALMKRVPIREPGQDDEEMTA